MPFRPGDPIVLREMWRGRVFEARPMITVQDEPHQLMLFLPGEVECGVPIGDDGNQLRLPDRPWHLDVRTRAGAPVLSFAWPKTPYSVLLWSTPDEGRVWYVNIESPLERTAIGFDTTDHALDVLVALDGSTVVWKDERELEEAVRGGLFSEQEADSFRRWGARAADRIRRREPPFDADWTGWRPDPSWGRPRLPHGWADA